MNSQIRIRQFPDNTFDYEIILKGHINYWYNNPTEYTISHMNYSPEDSKIVFQL